MNSFLLSGPARPYRLTDFFHASSPPATNLTLTCRSRSFSCTDLLTEPPREPAKPAAPTNALGLVVSDLPADKQKELGIRGGVQVDGVDGLAAAAGLRQGDVITQLNSVEVQNARQFNEAVGKLDAKKDVAVLVRRGEASRFIVIRR